MTPVERLDERYCRSEEAARLLGVNIGTLKRLVRQGEIPATRFGNGIIYEREILRQYQPRPVGRPGRFNQPAGAQ